SAKRGGSSGTATTPLLPDAVTMVTQPAPCSTDHPCPTIFDDSGSVTLRAPLKDIGNGTLAPTTNNEVTISRYTVRYVRADGRNVEGADVPYAIDGAVTGTIPAGGALNLGFEIVQHTAKHESPLAQLRHSAHVIVTNAIVTFYGQDRVGNNVTVQGQIQINFGNFGDET